MATAASSSAAIRPGLERMLPLLGRLEDPQKRFAVIHIAGTNCKGTTSSLLDSLLARLGIRTARFNSPHLRQELDSCRVAGSVVSASTWQAAGDMVSQADQLHQPCPGMHPIDASPFELLFARFLVSCTLSLPRPQVLIVECGMGGLLDATNVFPSHSVLASVITPIGRDHATFLGTTLRDITENKMGIAKEHGLVVVADQGPAHGAPDARQWSTEEENPQMLGNDAAEILSTVRRVAETTKARLVRCQTPSIGFGSGVPVSQVSGSWRMTSQWSVLLPPILQPPSSTRATATDSATGVSLDEARSASFSPTASDSLASTLFTNEPFLALPGHATLTTPLLPPLQPTSPVVSSLSTALSTIYSIASDEPPSARLLEGADKHEELRLGLAWAMRESGLLSGASGILTEAIEAAIVEGVEGWEGRGSWVDVPSNQGEEDNTSNLHLFVDGAHNLPAFSALFRHIQAMRQARGSGPLTITLIVSFSESKKKDGDLDAILDCFAQLAQRVCALQPIEDEFQALSLSSSSSASDNLKIRIGFVPFSTPIEGMPWVSPLPSEELASLMRAKVASSRDAAEQWEITSLPNLQEALLWAALEGQETGKPAVDTTESTGTSTITGEKRDSMVLLTGSLYLAGELYRLLDRARPA